ncbi:tautomerase family protein [Acinetobacter variabilis]|uniref:tautomerase family protein n=1 Tax=Acinetobacter TaxID=469 RepID=UPI000A99A7E6|nr:tautomerase family protein [Acinetobacter sp. YZS-X1-1]
MTHLAQPEYFTLIGIDCFAERSLETKRKLYQQIVASLGKLGIPSDHILIHLRESPLENWGIRGG